MITIFAGPAGCDYKLANGLVACLRFLHPSRMIGKGTWGAQMKVIFAAFVIALFSLTSHIAFAVDAPDPDMGHCTDDATVPAENIVAHCGDFISKAFHESWGVQYVPRAYYFEALADQRLGKIPEAEVSLARAIKMDPEYFDAWKLLVMLKTNLPEPVAEMKAVDAMIMANPHSPNVLNSACWVRATKGQQLDAAMADCNEALHMDPKNAEALDSRCFTRAKMGDFANAVADCDAALSIDPKLAGSLYVEGIAKLRLGQKDAGNANIAAAEAIDPSVAETYAGYGMAP